MVRWSVQQISPSSSFLEKEITLSFFKSVFERSIVFKEKAGRSWSSSSRTGHAGFLRSARPERPRQSQRRGRALTSRRARASASCPWRELPGVQPPRTCTILSIKRERQLAAPWRELPRAGTHRGRALAFRTSAAIAAAPRRELASPDTDPPPKNGGGICFFAEFSNGFLAFLVFFFEIC